MNDVNYAINNYCKSYNSVPTSICIIASEPNELLEYYLYNISSKSYILSKRSSFKPISKIEAERELANTVKIVGYENSSQIFNFTKIKSKLIGQEFTFSHELNYKCKSDGLVRNTVIINIDNPKIKKLRFLESDCEYVFTKPVIQVQIHKPNKNIRIGDRVKIINSKRLPFSKNTICTVINIKDSNHKYRDKKGKPYTNTKLACITYNGNTYYTLIKNLKKITNDTNNQQQKSVLPF
jgi:hypothetical protein